MKRLTCIIFSLALLLAMPFQGWADNGKFYTRKVLLGDFSAKMTKVVLSGDAMVDAVLREEISLRWDLSPYEFCTVDAYNSLKGDNNFYFLHFVKMDDVVFLSLDKGGPAEVKDVSKQGFEVVSVPVSAADAPVMENLTYIPAFIDIIQQYTRDAMESDGKAYTGLARYNFKGTAGKTVCLDPEEAEALFRDGAADTLVGVIATARTHKVGSWCYKMLISCDTHELYYYRKHKVSASNRAGWLDSEISRFDGK